MKYLLVLIVVVVAVNIWRHRRRAQMGSEAQNAKPSSRTIAPPRDMVACAGCGLHLPRDEALSSGGRYFCSAGHRDADARH